jgi:hypothetical protein
MSEPLATAAAVSAVIVALTDKTSKFVNKFYEPQHLIKMAQAAREVAIIKAQEEIEVHDLQRRAIERWANEEERHQRNIEGIQQGAFLSLEADANPNEIDEDWLENFFGKCRSFSDQDVQAIWSKVLASEANCPGRFSRKTINILGDIGKSEAELFGTLCRFECQLFGEATPLVVGNNQAIYTNAGLTDQALEVLSEVGLIETTSVSFMEYSRGRLVEVVYFDRGFGRKTFPDSKSIMVGRVRYTRAGRELASVCSRERVEGFLGPSGIIVGRG